MRRLYGKSQKGNEREKTVGDKVAGFIKLDRKIFSHWIFQDAEKFRAFVDLIQLAMWKDEKLLIGNQVITVKRGDYYSSIGKLETRWKWGRRRTEAFLNLLENENMIVQKRTSYGTLITIVNYSLYQDKCTTNVQTDVQTDVQGYVQTDVQAKEKRNSKPRRNDTATKEEYKEREEVQEGKEREEKSHTAQPLSFPTPYHELIYKNTSDVTYKTWYISTEIEDKGNSIKITCPSSFIRTVILEKHLPKLKMIFNKDIIVDVK